VTALSATNSNSFKLATATCPAGKRAIGSGGDILGAKSGAAPNTRTHVVIDEITPSTETTVPGRVQVVAFEHEPHAGDWTVEAYALCANVS
jgi:hypothetical protein